jgi:hypothetical protein
MRSLTKYVVPTLLILLSCNLNFAHSSENIVVSKSLIDIYLWAKFPIKKNLIVSELTLSSPKLGLQKDNQIVQLKVDFKISSPKKNIEGTLDAQSTIIYDSNTRFLIMKSPTLNNIQLKDEKATNRQIVNNVNALIPDLLNNLPIYRLDEKLPILGKAPNNIEILDSGILLKYE